MLGKSALLKHNWATLIVSGMQYDPALLEKVSSDETECPGKLQVLYFVVDYCSKRKCVLIARLAV